MYNQNNMPSLHSIMETRQEILYNKIYRLYDDSLVIY